MDQLTPKQIVDELNKYIIGQDKAKKTVAIALRNRYRRSRLTPEMREEVVPKNIIMKGPTGVGKTEIARRIARLMNAPFIKVEATKFTEVGYVGRDVESIIRDLVEAAVRIEKKRRMEDVRSQARANAEQRLVELLAPGRKRPPKATNPFAVMLGAEPASAPETAEERTSRLTKLDQTRDALRNGLLEEQTLEIEVECPTGNSIEIPGMGGESMSDLLSGILPTKTKKRRVTVTEARKILEQEEAEKLIDMDEVTEAAIESAEQNGIVFFDEIDKIAGKARGTTPDVSREGVQRDILPIVEGSTVMTKYGPVNTDYILFIAAGAFHVAKVSDLIPELQGRFPIQVELESLTRADFEKILSQPKNALTKQYRALLETENVQVEFTEDALKKIAEIAQIVNESTENIGARRLHTIMENLLEDVFFEADGSQPYQEVLIDEDYVTNHLQEQREQNMQKFVL